ncbi:MAG TPA: hypothetical protein VFN23_16265 [Ktedonobacteraceae bacterium]|nr:hypothetical protein [Ktedonobacteraceae bacterium]
MPWCKFFVPKIASPDIKPGDLDLNENIEYAKCIKGYVLRSAADWIYCENLPTPDSQCWKEGGATLLSLGQRKEKDVASEISTLEEEERVIAPNPKS